MKDKTYQITIVGKSFYNGKENPEPISIQKDNGYTTLRIGTTDVYLKPKETKALIDALNRTISNN